MSEELPEAHALILEHDTPLPQTAMSESEFNTWLVNPHSTPQVVYYSGFLAEDRGETHYRERTPEAVRAGQIGRAAMSAWEGGFVELVQRKVRDRWYDYIAVKRAHTDSGRKQFWSFAEPGP